MFRFGQSNHQHAKLTTCFSSKASMSMSAAMSTAAGTSLGNASGTDSGADAEDHQVLASCLFSTEAQPTEHGRSHHRSSPFQHGRGLQPCVAWPPCSGAPHRIQSIHQCSRVSSARCSFSSKSALPHHRLDQRGQGDHLPRRSVLPKSRSVPLSRPGLRGPGRTHELARGQFIAPTFWERTGSLANRMVKEDGHPSAPISPRVICPTASETSPGNTGCFELMSFLYSSLCATLTERATP